jgi:hypothetical protein
VENERREAEMIKAKHEAGVAQNERAFAMRELETA